jgi:hypothetical protein
MARQKLAASLPVWPPQQTSSVCEPAMDGSRQLV